MICLNCASENGNDQAYCSVCGQSYKHPNISVSDMIKEVFRSTFNFDNRFFRTLLHIHQPAKLTQAFVRGQRKRYAHPFRLFLVLMVFIISLSMWNWDSNMGESFKNDLITEITLKEIQKIIDSLKTSELGYDMRTLDSLENELFVDGKEKDSLLILEDVTFLNINRIPKIHKKDILEMDISAIIEKYNIENFWHKIVLSKYIQFNLNANGGVQFIMRNFVWTFLVSILLMSLFLKILYFRYNYFLVEHLVLTLYGTSFLILMIIFLNFSLYISDHLYEILFWIALFALLFIQLLTVKNYYRQSWLKTMLKTFVFNSVYLITSVVISLIGSVILILIY